MQLALVTMRILSLSNGVLIQLDLNIDLKCAIYSENISFLTTGQEQLIRTRLSRSST